MSAQHTPGPWAMPDSGQGRISKVGSNGGWDGLIATADCGDYARSKSEGLANARLIAAAPDLLAIAENFEITGPDADGLFWFVLHGRGTTGRAMFKLGRSTGMATQVALLLEQDRRAAIAKAGGQKGGA